MSNNQQYTPPVVTTTSTPPAAPAPAAPRAEGLPENFKTVADLAASYKEAQAKISELTKPATPPKADEGTPPVKKEGEAPPAPEEKPDSPMSPEARKRYSAEISSSGALSAESYAALEKGGYSKDVVDTYIRGLKGDIQPTVDSLLAESGGEQGVKDMLAWAPGKLPEAQINAFNRAMQSGDVGQVALALRGLRASYVASEEGGGGEFAAPKKTFAGRAGGGGTEPFGSTAQMRAAMRDPRYTNDRAYREEVIARIAASGSDIA